jgi:hypothetical protein
LKDSVSATGYTSVILVMNMQRFIADADQQRFERVRSSPAFLSVLRQQWRERLAQSDTFVPATHDDMAGDLRSSAAAQANQEPGMSTEEVAFLTGIFRQSTLDQYNSPTYYLRHKERIQFPDEILDNIQFKDLFAEQWRSWDVFVRPTVSGMFVLQLRRAYAKPTPLITIASDVLRLQMAFDLRSAKQKLRYFQQQEQLHPADATKYRNKQRSIHHLLEWLGADSADAAVQNEYIPVQWKLAMEVCRQLVRDVGPAIQLAGETIRLRDPARSVSTPLHDAYVIYHIDELIALAPVLAKARNGAGNGVERAVGASARKRQTLKELVRADDIYRSDEIRNELIGLIEGSVLKKIGPQSAGGRPDTDNSPFADRPTFFPSHHSGYLSDMLGQNCVTWNDEICLLASRAAVVMPSRQARPHELFICNFSTTKERVMYMRYWEALERMIEFCVEVRVLAQLLERMSSSLLHDFEQETHHIREGMLRQDVKMNAEALRGLTERVANLDRMLGVGQSLGTPSIWSRGEFAIEKAHLLFQQQDVPRLFGHVERNVSSLNSLLNHIDELYLADLSEQRNGLASLTSILLAGFSLIIILFTIPSFWSDSKDINPAAASPLYSQLIPYLTPLGTALALMLVLISLTLIVYSFTSLNLRRFSQRRTRQRRAGTRPS